MSLSSQLTTLAQTLADILDESNTALAVKGVVSSADTLGEVPEKIRSVPQSGGGVVPTGNIDIAQNTSGSSTLDIAQYATATVHVPTGTARSASDVTVSGKTVTVPAGLYASQVQKSVNSAEQATPYVSEVNQTSGIVSFESRQSEGYVNAGTKSATLDIKSYIDGSKIAQGQKILGVEGSYTGGGGGGSQDVGFGEEYVTAYRTGGGMLTFSNLFHYSGTKTIGVWITRNAEDAGSDDGYIGTLLAINGAFTSALYSSDRQYILRPDLNSAIHLTLSSSGTSGTVSIDTSTITGFGDCAYRVYPIYIEE